MIDGNQYIERVKSYFNFLIMEFNFKIVDEKINGQVFYDVEYRNLTRAISISYENIEDYLLITVFILQNGGLPDYDDKTKTLHLNALNRLFLSQADQSEIISNNKFFSEFKATSALEKSLLKSAKELRLCLQQPSFRSE